MRIATRTRVLVLSIMTALVVVGAVAVALVAPSGFRSSAAAVTSSYVGKAGTVTMLAHGTNWLAAISGATLASTRQKPRMTPYHTVNGHDAFHRGTVGGSAATHLLPHPLGLSVASAGSLLQNWNGLSDLDQTSIAGYEDTPPDPGLCVGWFGTSQKSVVELVNNLIAIYTPAGKLLKAAPLPVAFGDPNVLSDPRCFYDMSTASFYMTVISCTTCTTDTSTDVLVVSHDLHFATYRLDTSNGGRCFGDQPHTGYDANAVYISTDEFCGPGGNTYSGALLFGLSKPQLAAVALAVNVQEWGPLSLGSVPILTLEPAVGNDTGTEYLLNSFPFDQSGNINSVSNQLGFWSVKNDLSITTGHPATLAGQIISSEQYAFPVPAASTGDGSVERFGVTSEQFLNPGDDRMLQVQAVLDEHTNSVQLYAALDTSLIIGSDPSNRDGAAWFALNPAAKSITSQGYVGVAGAYLLYPAILHTQEGTTAITFTITSPTRNPSAAYVVEKSWQTTFGPVHFSAVGAGPHTSLSDSYSSRPRWGDYSAATLDPNALDFWMATEDIGAPGSAESYDNWGIQVMALQGDPED
jgi:hypothetical protein